MSSTLEIDSTTVRILQGPHLPARGHVHGELGPFLAAGLGRLVVRPFLERRMRVGGDLLGLLRLFGLLRVPRSERRSVDRQEVRK